MQSIIVLAEILKEQGLLYVHFGIQGSPHTRESPATYNKLLNIDKLFVRYDDLVKFTNRSIPLQPVDLHRLVRAVKENNTSLCHDGVIYTADNAWSLVYEPNAYLADYRFFISHSPIMHKMRKAFYASPIQPQLDFVPGRRNVVIHIRRGDAVNDGKGLDVNYFVKAAQYYMNYFRAMGDREPPLFMIETDDPKWPEIDILKAQVGAANFVIGRDYGDGISTAFSRMVKADGLVTSYSSFSRAAAQFRDLRVPIVACAIQDKHPWGTFVWFPDPFYTFVC